VVVVVAALAVTVSGGIIGWFYGATQGRSAFNDDYAQPAGTISPYEIGGCILGLVAGFLVAGTVFGVVAAIYDIQRRLAELQPEELPIARSGEIRRRQEPRI
jgi:hypothetical protein